MNIRPIWHQKQDRVQAHILVCFLAYVLWKTLAQLCRRAGLGDEPRRVLDAIKKIRPVPSIGGQGRRAAHQRQHRHPQTLRHAA